MRFSSLYERWFAPSLPRRQKAAYIVVMSSPPAVRAALYRLLCSSHGCAPTAAEAVLALKKQGVAADDEQVLQALGATVAEAADADALVAECVKRLRESDDGGENDLDKSLAEGARVVPVPTDVTNFASWEREESPHRRRLRAAQEGDAAHARLLARPQGRGARSDRGERRRRRRRREGRDAADAGVA